MSAPASHPADVVVDGLLAIGDDLETRLDRLERDVREVSRRVDRLMEALEPARPVNSHHGHRRIAIDLGL